MHSNHFLRISAGLLATLIAFPVTAAPITLDDATRRAKVSLPIQVAEADLAAATALAAGAASTTHQPELGLGVGPKLAGSGTYALAEISLSQTIELGGKASARRAVADAARHLAATGVQGAQQLAAAQVWRHFMRALVAEQRLTTTRDAEDLAQLVDRATQDRDALGAATQLELNLTAAEVGRAKHDRLDAERQLGLAITRLAITIGAGPDEVLEPVGELTLPSPLDDAAITAATSKALASRGDIQAADAAAKLAGAQVRAALAQRRGDLSVGIGYQFEQTADSPEHAVLLQASLPLPLWGASRAPEKSARALARRAELEQTRVRSELERNVAALAGSYRRAYDATNGWGREVTGLLHDNLELARQSFTSGKIDYYQFSQVRRDLVGSQLAYLDSVEDAIDAWAELLTATGGQVTL